VFLVHVSDFRWTARVYARSHAGSCIVCSCVSVGSVFRVVGLAGNVGQRAGLGVGGEDRWRVVGGRCFRNRPSPLRSGRLKHVCCDKA